MRVCMGSNDLREIDELKVIEVINKVQILLLRVLVFVFTKFQWDLSTFTSFDLTV